MVQTRAVPLSIFRLKTAVNAVPPRRPQTTSRKSRAQREENACARAVHRTQRAESFHAVCGCQMEVPRSTNAKLGSILCAASERPVNPLVDDKHREEIEANEVKHVQRTREQHVKGSAPQAIPLAVPRLTSPLVAQHHLGHSPHTISACSSPHEPNCHTVPLHKRLSSAGS